MFKFTATYKDLFDPTQEVNEEVYFHLIRPELVTFELEFEDGFSAYVKDVMRSRDNRRIFQMFVRLVEISYGRRDGKAFVKDPAWTREFLTSQAWEKLFIWLTDQEDGSNANKFWLSILPEDIAAKTNEPSIQAGGKKMTDMSREELLALLDEKKPAADLTSGN